MKQQIRDSQRLRHILEAAEKMRQNTENLSYDDFRENAFIQPACERWFSIIGEAAYKIDKELKEKTSDKIEWKKVVAFRHILIHEYSRIDSEIIWKTIQNKLSPLIEGIQDILNDDQFRETDTSL